MPAFAKNGMLAATTNMNPPSGPAIMYRDSVRPPTSHPFARSSWSRGTTAGTIDWAAGSNAVSPVLIRKSTRSSRTMLDQPARIATASTPIAAARAQSTATISRRRSTRSTRTPAGRANSSHGSMATPVVAATISAFDVRALTYSGAATTVRPVPSADSVLAVHSLANLPLIDSGIPG